MTGPLAQIQGLDAPHEPIDGASQEQRLWDGRERMCCRSRWRQPPADRTVKPVDQELRALQFDDIFCTHQDLDLPVAFQLNSLPARHVLR